MRITQQPSRCYRPGQKRTTVTVKVDARRWRRPSEEQERSRLLRGLIEFTAKQVKNLPVMKVGRPLRWQGTSLIICPAPGHYWGATPVGTFSANGWSGFVIVWHSELMRVPTGRSR